MDQNCNKNLADAACWIGNGSGIASTVLWFSVLLPQVIHNYHRNSVQGLSIWWAILNFTASLCNLFFMFRIEVPTQTRVMAVYMPVIELAMLFQFWLWADWRAVAPMCCSRLRLTLLCVCVWSAVVVVQIFWPSTSSGFAWAAIVCWSVETFPQLYVTMSSPVSAVKGQSAISILITVFGKTTDSFSAYLLDMPQQTRVLAYFSGTAAWLNALYVLVIFVRDHIKKVNDDEKSSSNEEGDEIVVGEVSNLVAKEEEEAAPWTERVERSIKSTLAESLSLRLLLGAVLVLEMIGVLVASVLTLWKPWVAALPIATLAILITFHVMLRRRSE